jgi:hypothetical protein
MRDARRRAAGPAPAPHPCLRMGGESDELSLARMVLVLHRLDIETGRCATCAGPSPCEPAQDAARQLAASGAWHVLGNTATVRAASAVPRRPQGWPVRLWQRLRGHGPGERRARERASRS